MADFAINGIAVKTPKELVVSSQTIDADSSGRTASGKMVRDIIAIKAKLAVKWPPMSDSEMAQIQRIITQSFFTVTYPDLDGDWQTKTFYAGDRSSPAYSFNAKFSAIKWSEFTVDFIER